MQKHGLIVRIYNRGNQFRTSAEPNLNSYFNELINFADKVTTKVVGEKNAFYLQYHNMNSYEIPPCYQKVKPT